MHDTYTPPELRDYGSLADLTAMLGVNGVEDGSSKMLPMHHEVPPSVPLGL